VEMVNDSAGNFWGNREFYVTQQWVIQSRRIVSDVVRALNLNKDAAFLDDLPAKAAPPPREVSVDIAVDILQRRLVVEMMKESRLAVLKYEDADPERTQRIVAAIADTYVQRNLDDAAQSNFSAADWLHEQLGSLKEQLETSEMRLHEYKKDKNILSLSMDDQTNMLRQETKQLNEAITAIRLREEAVRARRAELAKINAEDPQNLPATELIQSPTLMNLRGAYAEGMRTMSGLAGSGKGQNHPDVRAAAARVEATRSALLAEVRNIQGAVEKDVAALDQEERGVRKLFSMAEQRALGLNLLEIEYNRMARAKESNEKLYSLVLERSTESDLTRTLMFNNVRVVERPILPRHPVSPNVPMNLGGGLLAGLVLGLAAAFGREQLDRTMKTPDDVENEVGLPFLGLLPALGGAAEPAKGSYGRRRRRRKDAGKPPAEATELMVHERPMSGFAEAARSIRTNILFMSPDKPYRTLLITSAGPSEGKTTVACCIATAIAQAGRRVVLIDCDMRRPRMHRIFGVSNQIGVTTALIEATTLDELVHQTVVPNLSIVTTGPLPPNPAELLHSEAFARLIASLRDRFDCVIIDSPPVVPVTDAAVLSAAVDGTIIVFRAFQTTKELAMRAARAIHDVGGHVVGAVLNAVDMDRYEYSKGYYYYKREGYYRADDSASADSHAAPPS
jgi:succinoglycan biosynthesis transport protein ExoP